MHELLLLRVCERERERKREREREREGELSLALALLSSWVLHHQQQYYLHESQRGGLTTLQLVTRRYFDTTVLI